MEEEKTSLITFGMVKLIMQGMSKAAKAYRQPT